MRKINPETKTTERTTFNILTTYQLLNVRPEKIFRCKTRHIRTIILSCPVHIFFNVFTLHQTHEMLPIDDVCLSVGLSVMQLKSAAAHVAYAMCRMRGITWCSLRQMTLASCSNFTNRQRKRQVVLQLLMLMTASVFSLQDAQMHHLLSVRR